MERWATFDCYGTLIDWNGGLRLELARVFGEDAADAKLDEYHQVEPWLEESGERSYREVLTEAMRLLGAPAGEEYGLAESLPAWRPFSEVPHTLEELRRRGWKLALLSNTDDDLIAASQVQLGMVFDEAVVAQEIGSFKPAHKHWDEFFSRTRAPREGHVHVAASLFHDIVPCNELGLRSVWINRLGETATDESRPTRELTDLLALPETLDELSPLRPATADDAEAIAALFHKVYGDSRPVDAEEVRNWFRNPQISTDDVRVLEQGGEIVGYGDLFVDADVQLDVAAPGHSDVFLDWAEQRTRQAGLKRARVSFAESHDLERVVAARGYRYWRSSFTMHIELPERPPPVSLPDGRASPL